MKITTKQKENGLQIRLNGKYVGMDADCTDKIVSIETAGYKDCKLVGTTSTGKTFELEGGTHAGGRVNDYFLYLDDTVVSYANSAKELLELLCGIEWTEEQIDFSNSLYKKDTARKS